MHEAPLDRSNLRVGQPNRDASLAQKYPGPRLERRKIFAAFPESLHAFLVNLHGRPPVA
jgi:hypothetical protein